MKLHIGDNVEVSKHDMRVKMFRINAKSCENEYLLADVNTLDESWYSESYLISKGII